MKKQQQWTLLFKVFSQTLNPLINSSSSPSYNNALRRRPFCSLATTTTTTNTSCLFTHAVKMKNLPLLIVPCHDDDDQGNDGDGFKKMKETKQRYSSIVCDDTLGFTSLFDDDDDDDVDGGDLQKKKALVHKMHLPEIADRRICGSSEGWLITVHENTQVQLLNPITKVLVNLPPSTSLPEVVGKVDYEKENYKGLCYLVHVDISGFYDEHHVSSEYGFLKGYDSHYFRNTFFKKVVTSTTTDHANSTTVVMAIYGEALKLAFCRPSGNDEKKWMGCLQGDRGYYNDVTFYKENFYAVGIFGDVVVVKGLDGPSVPFVETIIERGEDYDTYTNYLVEKSSTSSSSSTRGGDGDLLMVMRRIEYPYSEKDGVYRTTEFKVMKLDFNGGGGPASLVEVTNLGEDCALFIGYNNSFSFSASKIPGCRGNCIYFTDNHSELFDDNKPYGTGHDMGVYNLEDGSIEKLNYETTVSFMPPPIWYVPN